MQMQPTVAFYIRSFMRSRVIITAAELDLFTILDNNPHSPKELSNRLNLDERATTRLLDCLITFHLLAKQDGHYRTTEEGSCLSSLHPQSILPSARHASRLWQNWSHLTTAVKEGSNPKLKSVTAPAEAPEQLAFLPGGQLAGLVERELFTLDIDRGVSTRFKLPGVAEPHALAFDSEGRLYVSDAASANVTVLETAAASAKRLGVVGKPGGRNIGAWDAQRMAVPRSLAVS